MQTAIATGYSDRGKIFTREDMTACLTAAAESGITHVHWAYQWRGDYLYTEDDIAFIKNLLRELGLSVKGIHGAHGWSYPHMEGMYKWLPQADGHTDIASMDETLRKKGSEVVKNRILLADELDTREVVLHVQVPYTKFSDPAFKEQYYAQVLKTLAENEAIARSLGVRICVENMVGTPNSYQFEEFDRIFDAFSPDYIGYCYDTGHANLTDPLDPYCLPRKYVDRIHMVHLNDNHGYHRPGDFSDDLDMGRSDEHYLMGDANLDFDVIAELLARSPYELPVVGEFKVHDEEIPHFLNRCRERMTAFTEKILSIRSGAKE